jgi:aspartate-semialdehyde dehydrogenase
VKVRNDRKILNLPALRVAATCVRVPVIMTPVAIHATFARPVDVTGAREVLGHAPGVGLR